MVMSWGTQLSSLHLRTWSPGRLVGRLVYVKRYVRLTLAKACELVCSLTGWKGAGRIRVFAPAAGGGRQCAALYCTHNIGVAM